MAIKRFLSATLLLAACGAPAPLPTEPNPTEATAQRVVKEAPAPEEFVGVITTIDSAVISAKVSAPLKTFKIEPGTYVKAGQLIAQLDDTELRNRLEQAMTNEQAARMEAGALGGQVATAHQKVTAEGWLERRGASSVMAVRAAQAEYAQASAQQAAAGAKALTAKAAREQAEKSLEYTEIRAPMSGMITNVRAHVGEVVQVGTTLATVFDPSDLLVKFAVPRERSRTLRPGQRVELTVDGTPRPLSAVIKTIHGAQEPPINFAVVDADIDDAKLAPGEVQVTANARVRIADARGAKR
ncbi:MAG TPA: efflux RND transporter periplasmic adaptor subunit [Kofleriaceae bacterium]|jgi:RND family efflux transporter MFP subunit|nr:efflux RND transporter periplasmic adaptor subunit [Kofleriaceae bacterium]